MKNIGKVQRLPTKEPNMGENNENKQQRVNEATKTQCKQKTRRKRRIANAMKL